MKDKLLFFFLRILTFILWGGIFLSFLAVTIILSPLIILCLVADAFNE